MVSKFTRRQAGPSIKFTNRNDLVALKDLIEAGKVTPLVDRTYPLTQTAQAVSYVGRGHSRGTVVIRVAADGTGQNS